MCPYGTDVLAVRDDLLVSAKYQVQELYFLPLLKGSSSADTYVDSQGRTFALKFKSRLVFRNLIYNFQLIFVLVD
jgi:hypothetical protein